MKPRTYPGTIEETQSREFYVCSLTLDISLFLGRLAVAQGRERQKIRKSLNILVNRLEQLAAE